MGCAGVLRRLQQTFDHWSFTTMKISQTFCQAIGMLLGFVYCSTAFSAPVVTVVNGGTGPKSTLAFSPASGLVETAVMDWSSSSTTKMDEMEMSIAIPTITLGAQLTTTSSQPDGISQSYAVQSVSVDEGADAPMRAQLETQLTGLVGKKGTVLRYPSGGVATKKAASLTEMEGLLHTVTAEPFVIFPSEPIGATAEWTVASTMDLMGLEMRRKTTYRLIEKQGSRVRMAVNVSLQPASMEVQIPQMPGNATGTIEAFESKGEGTVVVDLARTVPVSSEMRFTVATKIQINAENSAMQMAMDGQMHVVVRGQ